jgi:hypothetical protein
MLNKIKSRGYLYSAGIVANRIVPEFLFRARVFRVFRFNIPEAANSLQSYDDGIHFKWCESDVEFEQAQQLTHFRPPDMTQRYQACIAYDGQEAIGGVWIASESFNESELGLQIQLQPSQKWLFAANIAKSHRRRGIYGRLLRYTLHSVSPAPGSGDVLASINPTNKASIAAHRPMIAATLGTCLAARWLSLSLCGSTGQLKTTRAIRLAKPTQIVVA